MDSKNLFEIYLEDDEFAKLMSQEELIMDVTESFCHAMKEQNLSKSRLAKKMGKTKGYISQLLNGGKNLTLRSVADLALCLGYNAKFHLKRKGNSCNTDSIVMTWEKSANGTLPIMDFHAPDDYNYSEEKIYLAV